MQKIEKSLKQKKKEQEIIKQYTQKIKQNHDKNKQNKYIKKKITLNNVKTDKTKNT